MYKFSRLIAQANVWVRQYVSNMMPDFICGSVTYNLNASVRGVIFEQSGTA